jgi:hypothetical protein
MVQNVMIYISLVAGAGTVRFDSKRPDSGFPEKAAAAKDKCRFAR